MGLDLGAPDRANGAMFRDLLEAQAEAIVIVDEGGKIVIVNASAEEMFGYTREELVGQQIELLTPEGSRDRHAAHRRGYDASPHVRPMGNGFDLRARRKDGSEFSVEISLSTVHTDGGRLTTSRVVDITAREQAKARLQEAEERFRLAFEHAPIGMALIALDGSFIRVNKAVSTITGYSQSDLMELKVDDLAHPADRPADVMRVRDLLAGRIGSLHSEQRRINAAGETVWGTLSLSLLRDADGRPVHFIAQLEDTSDRKLMEDRLRRLADYDALTGVRNRRQFERDLALLIERCRRYREQGAMLMIDLDDFKEINDTYGHQIGDEVLKEVAAAVRNRLRSSDSVARLGGDEFAVLLSHITADKATDVAEDLMNCIAEIEITTEGQTFSPSASIGVAHVDHDSSSRDAILIEADRAMYARKQGGRGADAHAQS
jgi:diguanylate cyclase (GGDEF)-like protein/PAS domain S-box-containing protein